MEEIFVLRHGHAEDLNLKQHSSDFDRKLTPEGIKKIEKVASFFNKLDEEPSLVLSSPYLRAKETAELFVANLTSKPELKIVDFLSCGAGIRDIAKGIQGYSSHKKIVLVGHAPDLEMFLGKLIGASSIKLKKATLAKVSLNNNVELNGKLEWLVTPKIVRNLKDKSKESLSKVN